MRAILINPYTQTVSEVDTNGNIDGATGFYKLLGAADHAFSNMVELIRLGPDVDLWIDEEGALNDGRPVFQFTEGPAFAGAALLLSHDDDGESRPLPDHISLALLSEKIIWTDLMTTGEFGPGHSEPIDHPVFGKTMAIHTGDTKYRTAHGYYVYRKDGAEWVLASSVHFTTRADALIYAQARTLAEGWTTEVREAGPV